MSKLPRFTSCYNFLVAQPLSWWRNLLHTEILTARQLPRYEYWRVGYTQVVDSVRRHRDVLRTPVIPQADHRVTTIRRLASDSLSGVIDDAKCVPFLDLLCSDMQELLVSDELGITDTYSIWLAASLQDPRSPFDASQLPDIPDSWELVGFVKPTWYSTEEIARMLVAIESDPDSVERLRKRWEETYSDAKDTDEVLHHYSRSLAYPELIDNEEVSIEKVVTESSLLDDPEWCSQLTSTFQRLLRAEALSYWNHYLRDENTFFAALLCCENFTGAQERYERSDQLEAFRRLNAAHASILRVDRAFIPNRVTASRIGGAAPMRLEEVWPLDKNGRAMEFIIALNLLDAPYCPELLEKIALITFFVSVDEFAYTQVEGDTFVVRTYCAENIEELECDMIMREESPEGEFFWVGHAAACRWEELAVDYPCWDHPQLQLPDSMDDFPDEAHQYNLVRTKVGGYPSTLHAPLDTSGGYQFVLQLETESEVSLMWGDSGTVYLSYHPAKGSWRAELQHYQ